MGSGNIKRYFIFIIILILLFFVLFFLFNNKKKYEGNLLDVSIKAPDRIIIDNSLPINDFKGVVLKDDDIDKQKYFIYYFNIKNNNKKDINYKILLDKINVKNPISDEYIKLYLTDLNDKEYLGFNKDDVVTFNNLKDDDNSKILFDDNIKSGQIKKFKLRVFLSNSAPIEFDVKTFAMKISVK